MYRVKTICFGLVRPKTRTKLLQLCRPCSQSQAKLSSNIKDSQSGRGPTARNFATQAAAEPFLNGTSSAYVEEMYNSWLKDPNSVHKVSTFVWSYTLQAVMLGLKVYWFVPFLWEPTILCKLQCKIKVDHCHQIVFEWNLHSFFLVLLIVFHHISKINDGFARWWEYMYVFKFWWWVPLKTSHSMMGCQPVDLDSVQKCTSSQLTRLPLSKSVACTFLTPSTAVILLKQH